MFSSNYFKQSCIDSADAVAPENYYLPKLDFGEFFETKPGLLSDEENESFNLRQKNADELISKAQAEAREILAEAEKKAEAVMQKAMEESENVCAQKYNYALENGYKEGLNRGKEAAQNELTNILDELLILSDSLAIEKNEIAQSSQNLILDLAAEIAQKICGDCFVKDEKVFASMFQRSAKEMPAAQKLKLTVSDKDYKIMSFDPQKLLGHAANFDSIELCIEKNAQEGTLRVETAIMLLDAGINTQIGLLKKEIAKSF